MKDEDRDIAIAAALAGQQVAQAAFAAAWRDLVDAGRFLPEVERAQFDERMKRIEGDLRNVGTALRYLKQTKGGAR